MGQHQAQIKSNLMTTLKNLESHLTTLKDSPFQTQALAMVATGLFKATKGQQTPQLVARSLYQNIHTLVLAEQEVLTPSLLADLSSLKALARPQSLWQALGLLTNANMWLGH
ncbi:bacteriocin immunity protein [Weissella halotolerans]|uniref:Bacteriocin immunity protein n=1 Tax=Weissella halotolerans DSM 20190 TaxID=1123500 RepID=A0A0R2FVD0_9LACO|nr:bacteriocin immunity protein [Weissella halotolerans]KRN32371.1 hypothetical protein IV68_GL000722 [Weissella halotolerans DSM 20190]